MGENMEHISAILEILTILVTVMTIFGTIFVDQYLKRANAKYEKRIEQIQRDVVRDIHFDVKLILEALSRAGVAPTDMYIVSQIIRICSPSEEEAEAAAKALLALGESVSHYRAYVALAAERSIHGRRISGIVDELMAPKAQQL